MKDSEKQTRMAEDWKVFQARKLVFLKRFLNKKVAYIPSISLTTRLPYLLE